jgi:hypothetical protein
MEIKSLKEDDLVYAIVLDYNDPNGCLEFAGVSKVGVDTKNNPHLSSEEVLLLKEWDESEWEKDFFVAYEGHENAKMIWQDITSLNMILTDDKQTFNSILKEMAEEESERSSEIVQSLSNALID